MGLPGLVGVYRLELELRKDCLMARIELDDADELLVHRCTNAGIAMRSGGFFMNGDASRRPPQKGSHGAGLPHVGGRVCVWGGS